MNEVSKKQIQTNLAEFVARYPSQKKAVNHIKGVSEAICIQIKKGDFNGISDEMWRKVSAGIGYRPGSDWHTVETASFIDLQYFFDFAKSNSETVALVAPAGTGKTAFSVHYGKENTTAYHLNCSEYLNRKAFLQELMLKMGIIESGSVAHMMQTIVDFLTRQDHPLIILDEADKLTDQVLYFFISIYNMLEGKCGLILLGTEFLENRINKGRRLGKKGYTEIYSRIGRNFITIAPATKTQILHLCEVNGVTDAEERMYIYNESEGDMRRVKRSVKRFHSQTA